MRVSLALILFALATAPVQAAIFDGQSDNGTDQFGYYYAVTGGKFPTGTTPNGSGGSGGTFRFITDDPVVWGRPASQSGVWQKDTWYAANAGLAITLKNGSSTVYDNNSLEDGSSGDYYNYAGSTGPAGTTVAYSMSNNFDWIYAGYFKLAAETTITEITGYFVTNFYGSFDPNSPNIDFRMNIWSNVPGDLLPTNTGSFSGDVFTSDVFAGDFATSDTGVDRVGPSLVSDIMRLSYTLDTPLVLGPGEYWFSHDAVITPEPASMLVWAGLGLCVAGGRRLRKRRRAMQSA